MPKVKLGSKKFNVDSEGRAVAQHDRHKLVARVMKRYFSTVAHRLWYMQRF
jgi:hypothetical protein